MSEITQEQIEKWEKDSETLVKIKYEIDNHKNENFGESIKESEIITEAIVSYILIEKLRKILTTED